MNFFDDVYKKGLLESEKNIKFWEAYLHKLTSLDFEIYSDKLSVPILVPIGNKILFRGTLNHTNEVTVALGADYFTKCSVKQAEILRQHRIKDAKSKLEVLNKERKYFESQISFSEEHIHGVQGQDIIEMFSEEEDIAWRKQHKEKVHQYYQNKEKGEIKNVDITDDELWSRLEELELQEELQNELTDSDNAVELDTNKGIKFDSLVIKENEVTHILPEDHNNEGPKTSQITLNIPKQTSKLDLLQQVIDRQKMLEEKLSELRNRETVQSKTESDLLSRLDEMEQLEELEDEMDRIDDIIQEEDEEDSSVKSEDNLTAITRNVSFADQEDNETVQITFKHSNVEASKEQYNKENSISKPSDIYEAYSSFFKNDTTSILKKSKYQDVLHSVIEDKKINKAPDYTNTVDKVQRIVVKDVIEKTNYNDSIIEMDTRPISLFKKKRQQQKL